MNFSEQVDSLIQLALREDIASGDITSEATIASDVSGEAYLLAREELCFCSHDFVTHLCKIVEPELQYLPAESPANLYLNDSVIGNFNGSIRALLTLERTLLNFVQRLSGVATRTTAVVKQLADTEISLLDTRKTTPGWRELEKYAVFFGGGENHRRGLFDAFLIKNNHIDALGGDIAEAIRRCRSYREGITLEVEVRNTQELCCALAESPDWILLDNMDPTQLKEAVALCVAHEAKGGHRPKLEASGGYTPDNITSVISTGIDAVSMGWLTHSAPAVDISFRYKS